MSYYVHNIIISNLYEGEIQEHIIQMEKRRELLFLYATCLLDLIYNPTKYYQAVIKNVGVKVRPTASPRHTMGK